MKKWYDKDAKSREFGPGDKVLVLFPIPGHPLQARYHGPYTIEPKGGKLTTFSRRQIGAKIGNYAI